MDAVTRLTTVLTALADCPVVLAVAIIAATFVLEDLATITVALLVAHMVIGGWLALAALVAGTALGDIAIYLVARLAGDTRPVRRLLDRPLVRPAKTWLAGNAVAMVVFARFVPGLRLPVFAGAGSVQMPFARFAITITLATLVWTPGLYLAARELGVHSVGLGTGGTLLVLAGALFVFAALPRIIRALGARGRAATRPALIEAC